MSDSIVLMKRSRFSQFLAAVLVNSVYEMRELPDCSNQHGSFPSVVSASHCFRESRELDRGGRGRRIHHEHVLSWRFSARGPLTPEK